MPNLEMIGLDYSQIRERFQAIIDGKTFPANVPANRSHMQGFAKMWKQQESWIGCSIADMRDYVANGFKVSELSDLHPDLIPARNRRRLKFDEDGELQLDLVFSGFDYPFLEWEKREKKPGLRVNIGFDFNADVSAAMIKDYAVWLARALQTLENEGFDCEVNLSMRIGDAWPGAGRKEILIRVKRENEASDFSQWSAMFSPGGFRMLGFVAIVMAGDLEKATVNETLGEAITASDWRIGFDTETQTLSVENPDGRRGEFPSQRMTDDLKLALTQAKSG